MRKALFTFVCTSFVTISLGQQNLPVDTTKSNSLSIREGKTKVAITTDLDFASSANAITDTRSGIGTLGVKFKKSSLYGGINFTVFAQNESIEVNDSIVSDQFGGNLLIPQNSTNTFSSFAIELGLDDFEFLKNTKSSDFLDLFKQHVGIFTYYNLNNTLWSLETISSPVTINSGGIEVRIKLLYEEVLESNEEIKVTLFGGFAHRSLGGDYSVTLNDSEKESFLGTSRVSFNGARLGARLELSKFYGEVGVTTFSFKQKIAGFSGSQAIIRIGLIADINLPTKSLMRPWIRK